MAFLPSGNSKMKILKRGENKQGFTLIELLVVIAIIGILSSVVLAALNTARAKSRDSVRQQALTELRTALELYATDHNGQYPLPVTGGYASQCPGGGWGGLPANNVIPGLVPNYIPSMPADPAMNTATNADCIIYISNGTGYKVIDFNMVDSPSPGAVPGLLDPERNAGQPYANEINRCPDILDQSISWAVYTPDYRCELE
jgi:prepilin-type N-terminal cleavage/methylation domain-containing protein